MFETTFIEFWSKLRNSTSGIETEWPEDAVFPWDPLVEWSKLRNSTSGIETSIPPGRAGGIDEGEQAEEFHFWN